jgi:Protein of unknown function, DUF488
VSGAATVERWSLAELTRAVFGDELSMDEAWSTLAAVELPDRGEVTKESGRPAESASEVAAGVWVASIGYELHKDHRAFAQHLSDAGIERLIDVRDLPISRRRGYAKTALSEALADEGVEYLHAKALGNPKPFRDLYKSGRVEEGRARYREHLLNGHLQDLRDLVVLLREKRSALMCVEHDPGTCHRSVIIEVLGNELDVKLDVAEIA